MFTDDGSVISATAAFAPSAYFVSSFGASISSSFTSYFTVNTLLESQRAVSFVSFTIGVSKLNSFPSSLYQPTKVKPSRVGASGWIAICLRSTV